MSSKNSQFHDLVEKVWPKTKLELEKGMVIAKKIIEEGQKNIRILSEASVKETKKLSINLKREKLYHDLGKAIANTPEEKWAGSEKIKAFVDRAKKLEQEIKKIK